MKPRELQIKGKIDYFVNEEGKNRPIEIKKSATDKLYRNDELQMLSYLYLMKSNEMPQPYGYVLYKGNKRKFKVILTPENEKRLNEIIREIDSIDIDTVPNRKFEKKFCNGCSFFDYCWCD